jgi:hypothetical protein
MEHSICNIVSEDKLDKNIKTSRLRSDLRKRRYPGITEAEKVFFSHIEKLGLNEKFRLIPPQDFEGDTFRLTLDFKNLQDLKQHQKKLNEIIINPEFKKILS